MSDLVFQALGLLILWLTVLCEPAQSSQVQPLLSPVISDGHLNVSLQAQVSVISDLQCQKELVCRIDGDEGALRRLLDISIMEKSTKAVLTRVASIFYINSKDSTVGDSVETRSGIFRDNGSLVVRKVLLPNTGFSGEEFTCTAQYVDWTLQLKSVESGEPEEAQDIVCKVPDLFSKMDSLDKKFGRLSVSQAQGNVCTVPEWVSSMETLEGKLCNQTSVHEKLESIEAMLRSMSDARRDLNDVEGKIYMAKQSEVENQVKKLCKQSDKFEVLEKKVDGLERMLTSLSSVNSKLDFLQSTLNNLSNVDNKLDFLQRKMNNLSNVENKISCIQGKLNKLADITLNLTEFFSKSSDVDHARKPTTDKAIDSTEISSCESYRDLDDGHSIPSRQIITWPNGVRVVCDTTTAGGGWTVFQRRFDGRVNFNRTWQQYENGFGNLDGEFWMGLKYLQYLVETANHELRIDMKVNGSDVFAQYTNFNLSLPRFNYKLTVDGFSGTVTRDSMENSNGRSFSTPDRDHDNYNSGNCAQIQGGGWWYDWCAHAVLNQDWKSTDPKGVYWNNVKYGYHRVQFTEMKVRKKK